MARWKSSENFSKMWLLVPKLFDFQFTIYTEQKWKRYSTIIYILWKVLDKKYLLKLNNVSRLMSKLCAFISV